MDFEVFKRRSWRWFFMLFCVGLLLQGTRLPIAFAEETSQNDEWTFAAAPYMWFVSLDGDVTVKGQKSDVDMDFSDIWDEMNIGAMIAFEASNSRWGVLSDVFYANLGNDSTVDGIKIEPSFDIYVTSLGGFYRFGTWNLGEDSAATVSVDGIASGRYTYLDLELDFKGIGKASGHHDWLDPVVGARALFDFSEHWTLGLEGSIGGFGVGSDFTWHAAGRVGYRFDLFSEKDANLIGGYRALSWDYSDGSGLNKFEWDVTLHGPILGLVVTF
jgi:hypothetical protein